MIFFISDLHLGDGSKADDFHYIDEFLNFLKFAKDNCQQLIIVGDLFELWQCNLDKILFYHHKIIEELFIFARECSLVYIIGNHDYIPFVKFINSKLNIIDKYRNEEDNLYAEHGNQYDIFNRKYIWGRIIASACGLAEKIIHPDFDEWAARTLVVKNKVPPSSIEYIKRGGSFTEYDSAALALVNKGYKIVIFGHTHRGKIIKFENGIYANCGAWSGSLRPTYIALNKEKIELRDGITHSAIETINRSI